MAALRWGKRDASGSGNGGVCGAVIERRCTVGRLKRACELAQGFCLTALIILLAVVAVSLVKQAAVLATTTDEEWGARTTWVERLLVGVDDGYLNAVEVPGGDGLTSVKHGDVDGGPVITDKGPLVSIVQSLAVGGIEAAMLFLGARFFGRIAKTGDPFRRERARELGVIARLMIVASFAPGLLVWAILLVGRALLPDWPVLYTAGDFSYYLLACGCLLLAFAKVFEYGCILQQQDDELV